MSVLLNKFIKKVANELISECQIQKMNSYKLGSDKEVYIVHSMMKTATTSVGDALVKLNIGKRDHGWRPNLEKEYRDRINAANTLVTRYTSIKHIPDDIILSIRIILEKFVAELDDYSIFSDFPVGHIHINPIVKKILFPKAKFIWLDRDETSWLKSVKKWQLSNTDVFTDAVNIWNDETKAQKNLLREYKLQREKIINLKRDFPDDVIIMKIEQGWGPICKLVSISQPNIPFPHSNETK